MEPTAGERTALNEAPPGGGPPYQEKPAELQPLQTYIAPTADDQHAEIAKKKRRLLIGLVVTGVIVGLLVIVLIAVLAWHFTKVTPPKSAGLFFHPNIDEKSRLITFKQGVSDNYKKYKENLSKVEKAQRLMCLIGTDPSEAAKENVTSYVHTCQRGQSCLSYLEKFNYCVAANDFGYFEGKPCVLLELKPPADWKPKPKLPPNYMLDSSHFSPVYDNQGRLANIPVTCQGRTATDRDNLGQPTYSPLEGYPACLFPLKDQEAFGPIVAVQFNPSGGVVVDIECKIWAQNAGADFVTNFMIMVD